MISFIKKEAVFVISMILALVSVFIIPPDLEYLGYIDFRVICLLFVLMSVVAGFKLLRVFEVISNAIVNKISNLRYLVMVLWMLCFFMSMVITNDVALITFVPLAILTLNMTNNNKYIIYTVILQTIAANMGSMLTPMGNPQNLYLYSYFNVDTLEFFKITIPVIVLSFILLLIFSIFVPNTKINVNTRNLKLEKDRKLYLYLILALLSLLAVFKVIDYKIVTIITFLSVFIIDRRTLMRVDWFLLLTFIFFFIFVGNIGRITFVVDFISKIIYEKELIISVIASQFISNVPAAVMLSGFTNNYKALILGTDIGGLGTLIASLASLISFKIYSQIKNSNTTKYLLEFTVINVIFIIILLTVFIFCYKI
ncbi:MAG: SLC13 family permease [Lachnospirales bacterium]